MPNATLSNVAKVYRGRSGKCCCGCSGKYRFAKAHLAWAATNRGYEVDDNEVNDSYVKKIWKIIADPAHHDLIECTDSYMAYDDGTTLFIAYFMTGEPVLSTTPASVACDW
jgi:hypothetical protein